MHTTASTLGYLNWIFILYAIVIKALCSHYEISLMAMSNVNNGYIFKTQSLANHFNPHKFNPHKFYPNFLKFVISDYYSAPLRTRRNKRLFRFSSKEFKAVTKIIPDVLLQTPQKDGTFVEVHYNGWRHCISS